MLLSSLCLPVCPHRITQVTLNAMSWILILGRSTKSDYNNGYFLWRFTCTWKVLFSGVELFITTAVRTSDHTHLERNAYIFRSYRSDKYFPPKFWIRVKNTFSLQFPMGLNGMPRRWRQQSLPKCWYLSTRLYGVTSQTTGIFMVTAVRISNVVFYFEIFTYIKLGWIGLFNEIGKSIFCICNVIALAWLASQYICVYSE
jgi:hypothetical protein